MKYLFIVISASILGVAAFGCVPAAKSGHPSGAAAGESAAAVTAPSADAHAYERRAAATGRTFLDTLNNGKEIGVAESDLPPIIEMSAAAVPTAALAASSSPSAVPAVTAEPRFRIQILASSQVDMVRREQQKAEATTDHPVIMVAEQSLFKLYVGEFGTKTEAEAALPGIKRNYPDAWIVNK